MLAKKVAFYGSFLAVAMIFSYVELLIPFNIGVPGIKLGLANLIAVILLYRVGFIRSLAVNTARIVLSGILFGNALSIFYSICGGILAVCAMALLKNRCKSSHIGVSVLGAFFHNTGQIMAARILLGNAVFSYYPPLIIIGVITGILIGIAAYQIDKRLPKFLV